MRVTHHRFGFAAVISHAEKQVRFARPQSRGLLPGLSKGLDDAAAKGDRPAAIVLPSSGLQRLRSAIARSGLWMVFRRHDILRPRLTQRNPTWLVEVSIGSACRAAGRYLRQ
jgi:hypothetical protein